MKEMHFLHSPNAWPGAGLPEDPRQPYIWESRPPLMSQEQPAGDPPHPEMSEGYNAADTMPNNVSDLLTRAQLDNARDVYRVIESRSELNPYQDRELAVKIIDKLVEYHGSVIEKLVEESNTESIVGWSIDLHKLQLAIELLKDVDLSDD
mgnify:CR=1 FL=1